MKLTRIIAVLLLFVSPIETPAQKAYTSNLKHSVTVTVTDKETKESIIMATVQLQPAEALAVTDMEGRAIIRNVDAGLYTLTVSYVGYQPIRTRIRVDKSLRLTFQMEPTTLALNKVASLSSVTVCWQMRRPDTISPPKPIWPWPMPLPTMPLAYCYPTWLCLMPTIFKAACSWNTSNPFKSSVEQRNGLLGHTATSSEPSTASTALPSDLA